MEPQSSAARQPKPHRNRTHTVLQTAAAAVATAVFSGIPGAHAHPLCLDFSAPLQPGYGAPNYEFCTSVNGNPDGACCSLDQEATLKGVFDGVVAAATARGTPPSQACTDLFQQVTCGSCQPWSAHLFQELGTTLGPRNGMMLCHDFCGQVYTECGASLQLPTDFCARRSRVPDEYYCYPFTAPAPEVVTAARALQSPFPLMANQWPGMMVDMKLVPGEKMWWIVSQLGTISSMVDSPTTAALTQVLDIQDFVQFSGEMGLLGLAFHPNFAVNKAFYVNFVDRDQVTNIVRYTYAPGNADLTRMSRRTLMSWPQPEQNHNAGWISFQNNLDPAAAYHDLYIATGDGGGANDMHGDTGNAQDLSSPLGKMLRVRIWQAQATIAVGPFYSIPTDNPFVGATAVVNGVTALGTVYAYGLRNPWRCSFDLSNNLICGDVGQDSVEEVNMIKAGANYGWRYHEGTRVNIAATNAQLHARDAYEPPIFEYCHQDYQDNPPAAEAAISAEVCKNQVTGQSITGGVLFHLPTGGPALYAFADFETSTVTGIWYDAAADTWHPRLLADATNGVGQISSFAVGAEGQVFLVSYNPPTVQLLECFHCDGGVDDAAAAAAAAGGAPAAVKSLGGLRLL
eukprot:TRINITY_DN3651_c0_g1_i1.p1 TRINITY_DN3651_c0_g1~~TRINITY_DN3651_c0_g1_i1.p1  ORF type:complete len:626 (+),score=165.99 TRINITY_DN3651_c0_g1_i1:383-2260(+)